ncbi:hypothetical protein MYAM1_000274 [Malassezia yamatoensis]|uniref:AP complex subunit beta n=1 Tax=Malassezia yamatoensis TaxID=253288 RepID=A0AAJ5YP07_9BASI|nr:hypothetical protein MYAM1_000274 [Malassezia yamatoensis]
MAEVRHEDRYFQHASVEELRIELSDDRKGKSLPRKRAALKTIIANATMGRDMRALFPEVIDCMDIPALDVKRMVSTRALALRSMSYVPELTVMQAMANLLGNAVKDQDTSVRRTAVLCIAKLHKFDPSLVETYDFLRVLKARLSDDSMTVASGASLALYEILEHKEKTHFTLDFETAEKLASKLTQLTDWEQTSVLELLLFCVPQTSLEAETLSRLVSVGLKQSLASSILAATKVLLYLMNYISNEKACDIACRKISNALVSLLTFPAEIQYVALRNILLVTQRRPQVLYNDVHYFFRMQNDPPYLKLTKLEVICRLVQDGNVMQVLPQLKAHALDSDINFARKAINTMGRIALRLETAASPYTTALCELVETGKDYVVPEVMIIAKDILRKYPNQHQELLHCLFTFYRAPEEPMAKIATIWILGQYAERIEGSEELLEDLLYQFLEEPAEIQLAMLTATVKLFLKKPSKGDALVPKVLNWATQDVQNPDCRERGHMYWRLLSTKAEIAKKVILAELPVIDSPQDKMENLILDQLLLQSSSLASIYQRNPESFIRNAKDRYLANSQALLPEAKQNASKHLYERPNTLSSLITTSLSRPLAPVSVSMRMGLEQTLPDVDSLATPNESILSDLSPSAMDDTSLTLTSAAEMTYPTASDRPFVGTLI